MGTISQVIRHAPPALLVVMTMAGCSLNPGPSGTTTVVFDGNTKTITGPVTCTTQSNGGLVILATGDGQQTVRVVLGRQRQLIVDRVGIRLDDVKGFTDVSADMWATKVDDTYTINGWMPANTGESARHQFRVEIVCRIEVPVPIAPPPGNGMP